MSRNAALAGAARSDQFGDTAITSSRISPSVPNAQALGTVPDPIEVFHERSEARALLFGHDQMSLHDAVDELQAAAERTGLIDRIGRDEVQAIMSAAFAAVRVPPASVVPEPEGLEPSPSTPKSTIDAFWTVVRCNDPERLKSWLRQRPADVPVLLKLLEGV
jgi:hypothetical protein